MAITVKRRDICAYCNTAIGSPEELRAHVMSCEKHPLRKITMLVARLLKHGPCPFERDVSREYVDAYHEASRFVNGMGVQI